MTPDEERRANLAKVAITAYLGEQLLVAKRSAEAAVGTDSARARETEWRQASDRVQRWNREQHLDDETVVQISGAFLQAMEDAYTLVQHSGEVEDAEPHLDARQRAAVTREWLRDQGYDVPVYDKEPGL